jgi:oxygen-independent coproporphyrinogen-3 oxidase
MNKAGVYIHIPFCIQRCHYCSFHSQAVGSLPVQSREALCSEYLEAVKREADLWQLDFSPSTLYLGGGTPSLLGEKLPPFIEWMQRHFALPGNAEITVEANPGTVEGDDLAMLVQSGVGRLSLGLQSSQDFLLQSMGRLHSWDDFLRTWQEARGAGFDNISVDLIYGLPGQSMEDWMRTMEDVLALGPEHISVYALSVEEDTPWGELPEHIFPRDALVADEYEAALDVLESKGYIHYELSNWARPGRESRHNLLYWTGGEYLGLGASAHSYLGGNRVWNSWPVSDYLERIAQERRPITYSWSLPGAWRGWGALAGGERLSFAARRAEALILRLRLTDGVDLGEFRAQWGIDPKWQKKIHSLVEAGLLATDPLRLTRRGLLLANQVFIHFIED